MEVNERIDPRGSDIKVDREIARRVEQRIRIAPFVRSECVVMRERIHAGMENVGVAAHVAFDAGHD